MSRIFWRSVASLSAMNRSALRHVLFLYMDYYNRARTHLSLNKDAPVPRAIQAIGAIHANPILVPTIAFRRLFVCLVLGHQRRKLLGFAVTEHPTGEWLARQITEAFPWDTAPKYLIRDNDRAFGGAYKARVHAWGSGISRPRTARPGRTDILNA